MHRNCPIVLMALAALLFSGCMHVISPQARDAVDQETTFAQVRTDPERHEGKTLLLGGVIVDIRIEKDGTTLEIYRWKLDRWGEPIAVDETGGRFLARTDRLLDPALYDPGRLITLTATVKGRETHPLGQIEYSYPVFHLDESYPWETPFRIGIHRHPNIYVPYYVGPERPGRTSPYDPGYYTYPYTPYWIRSLAR
jgi:outer membrane lipoprotein